MKRTLILFLLVAITGLANAQREYHVFPKSHPQTPGSASGDGSMSRPWDLQTALSQHPKIVNGGDTIWLHEGIYNGRYLSTLQSNISGKFVTVKPYNYAKVVLNGNVSSDRKNVLEVRGQRVIYQGFEITFLGQFSRVQGEPGFQIVSGLSHSGGVDCRFEELSIHNNPGSGVGSWKHTGATVIKGCRIYNNGYMSKARGSGVGIYVQNGTDRRRVIINNIIFNNYYKGIEVWSDNRKATNAFVKNVDLVHNVLFNNGSPSGQFRDNLIIGTNDNNAKNIARNIVVKNNIFYHNANVAESEIGGGGASITLGWNSNAPVENISLLNNIIVGRNNGVRIMHARTLSFRDNIIYSGYVHLKNPQVKHINANNWKFGNNAYYTKNANPFRVLKLRDFTMDQWQSSYGIDSGSQARHLREFNLPPVLKILRNTTGPGTDLVLVLFSKAGQDVTVNLSEYKVRQGSSYTLIDIENPQGVLVKGKIGADLNIKIPMRTTAYEKPLHNTLAQKTPGNFGVYRVVFD